MPFHGHGYHLFDGSSGDSHKEGRILIDESIKHESFPGCMLHYASLLLIDDFPGYMCNYVLP